MYPSVLNDVIGRYNARLTVLRLGMLRQESGLGKFGALELGLALAMNCSLTELRLTNGMLSEEGAKKLVRTRL